MSEDDKKRIEDIIYKRRNNFDIVNDPEAIASCKREQNRDIIDNSRLGSYDKFGNYVIIPEIKRELISLPKLVYNQYNGGSSKIYELKSSIPIFNDVFMKLVINGDMANLLVCEQVNREAGGYLEQYEEVIDSLAIGTEERMPESLIFRTYNIYNNPNDFGKELKDSKFDNILTRKVYLSLLAKELKNVSTLDEKDAFKNMISTLKHGGDYGNKVINEFLSRLKERPAIFEISKAENYNKAMNEVLLSSLEIATTEEDKQQTDSRQVYLEVLSARDKNIENELLFANDRVSESYVKHIVDKAKQDFVGLNAEELSASDEFYATLNSSKVQRKRTLDKPILKQGKESKLEEPKTKEEKIKQILAKKESEKKKTPKGKKLKASKGKKAVKKLKPKAKKKAAKKVKKAKKKVKAKIKSKKKVKKPKKKLGKKKSAKKKVKRKIAKKKLKAKKGKLKSKKKKVKKAKRAKKQGKFAVKKRGGAKPQKFLAPKEVKKKKASGPNLALKAVLYEKIITPEKDVSLTYKVTTKEETRPISNTQIKNEDKKDLSTQRKISISAVDSQKGLRDKEEKEEDVDEMKRSLLIAKYKKEEQPVEDQLSGFRKQDPINLSVNASQMSNPLQHEEDKNFTDFLNLDNLTSQEPLTDEPLLERINEETQQPELADRNFDEPFEQEVLQQETEVQPQEQPLVDETILQNQVNADNNPINIPNLNLDNSQDQT